MASNTINLRSLYRSLLRELPPRPLLSNPPSHLHGRLRASFSSSPKEQQQQPSAGAAAAAADQMLRYLRSQRTYVALLERYNPGMNMDEQERVRLTARRVGMNLPIEFGGDQ